MKRGVDVRVIIPASPDSKAMQKVNAAEVADLVKMGAKVYEYPGMTHLKATVCDGWITFGSANYDTLSMRINRELNLATSHAPTVRNFVELVFEPDFRKSSRMTLEAAKAKGTKLGGVRPGAANITLHHEAGNTAKTAKAKARAELLREEIEPLRSAGMSLKKICS